MNSSTRPDVEQPELSPCPWCNVPPEVVRGAGYGFSVECVNETCQVGPSLNLTRGRKNAIKAWNARVSPVPAEARDLAVGDAAQIEQLKQERQQWLDWADTLTGNKHHLASAMRREIESQLTPTPDTGDAARKAAEEIWEKFWSDLSSDKWAVKDLEAILAKYFAITPDAVAESSLPSWENCELIMGQLKTATALQAFIYHYEPAGDAEAKRFRLRLTAAIADAVAQARSSNEG